MFIHEVIGEFRKSPKAVKVGAALSSLLIILPGCGGGSSDISKCPPEYYKDASPVNPAKLLSSLHVGTSALRARIRQPDSGERDVAVDDIYPRFQPAAQDIFRVDNEASAVHQGTVLVVGSERTDTNVDEPGEIVCSSGGGEHYPTLDAEQAVVDLAAAGIDINNGPPAQAIK